MTKPAARPGAAQAREALRRAGLRLPRRLVVALTTRCNLRCRHCWVEAEAAGADAPLEGVLAAVDAFVALGGTACWLTGGEPLLHPGFGQLLEACLGRAELAEVGIQTNATRITEALAAGWRQDGAGRLRLQVSLDGGSAASHDRIRGAGTFARALAGLETLVAHGLGPATRVACTETADNIDELPGLLARIDALGLEGLNSAAVVACGRAGEGGAPPPRPDQYVALVERYRADPEFRERADRLGAPNAVAWWLGREGRRRQGCTFVENPYLTATGTLYPCVLLQAPPWGVGDVYAAGLHAALIQGAGAWAALRDASARRLDGLEVCRGCPVREACGGGCTGRAVMSRGGLEGPEDRCALRRAVHGVAANRCPR